MDTLLDIIGTDCIDIINNLKHEMEMYDLEYENLQRCIDDSTEQHSHKSFKTNLLLGDIKEYYIDNRIFQDIQFKLELIQDDKTISHKWFDADFKKFDLTNSFLTNLVIDSFSNSYEAGVICIGLGTYNIEDFDKLIDELRSIIYTYDIDYIQDDPFEEIDGDLFDDLIHHNYD